MSERRALFSRPEGPLRVAIESPDPLVEAGLRGALAGDAQLELASARDPQALVVYDLGPARDGARARLDDLTRGAGAVLVLIADAEHAPLALAAGAAGVL